MQRNCYFNASSSTMILVWSLYILHFITAFKKFIYSKEETRYGEHNFRQNPNISQLEKKRLRKNAATWTLGDKSEAVYSNSECRNKV